MSSHGSLITGWTWRSYFRSRNPASHFTDEDTKIEWEWDLSWAVAAKKGIWD